MSNKTFTQKEIEVLRTSPYVQNVSQSMVFFSASFKEQFWKMLCDFDVIADLTATEVFEFLEYLNAPRCIIDKAPSAGLFDGQTDEQEMGVTYKAIDDFLLYGTVNAQDKAVIDRYHNRSEHKRKPLVTYKG